MVLNSWISYGFLHLVFLLFIVYYLRRTLLDQSPYPFSYKKQFFIQESSVVSISILKFDSIIPSDLASIWGQVSKLFQILNIDLELRGIKMKIMIGSLYILWFPKCRWLILMVFQPLYGYLIAKHRRITLILCLDLDSLYICF